MKEPPESKDSFFATEQDNLTEHPSPFSSARECRLPEGLQTANVQPFV
jgi:hypothetical protein